MTFLKSLLVFMSLILWFVGGAHAQPLPHIQGEDGQINWEATRRDWGHYRSATESNCVKREIPTTRPYFQCPIGTHALPDNLNVCVLKGQYDHRRFTFTQDKIWMIASDVLFTSSDITVQPGTCIVALDEGAWRAEVLESAELKGSDWLKEQTDFSERTQALSPFGNLLNPTGVAPSIEVKSLNFARTTSLSIDGTARENIAIFPGFPILNTSTNQVEIHPGKIWGGVQVFGNGKITQLKGTEYIDGYLIADYTRNHPLPLTDQEVEDSPYSFGGNDPSWAQPAQISHLNLYKTGDRYSLHGDFDGLSLFGLQAGSIVSNLYIEGCADDCLAIYGGAPVVTNFSANTKVNDTPDKSPPYTDDVIDVSLGFSGYIHFNSINSDLLAEGTFLEDKNGLGIKFIYKLDDQDFQIVESRHFGASGRTRYSSPSLDR